MTTKDKVQAISDFYLNVYGAYNLDLNCKKCSGVGTIFEKIDFEIKETKCTKCIDGKTRVLIYAKELLQLLSNTLEKPSATLSINKYGELFLDSIALLVEYEDRGLFEWGLEKELSHQKKDTIDFIYWFIFTRD